MDRIESYVLIKRLAIGGMGEIFLAEKQGALGIGKRVVLKRMLPDLARDQQFISSFEDEARIAMQFNHSNIVQVFDFGRDNDQLYLVSEYVDGADLGKILTLLKNQGKRLPMSMALGVLIRVAAALSYAHKKSDNKGKPLKIVHRDVNPSNVLISFNGDVKLTDFGIAKFEARKARTLPNQIKGKVMYLAPEMITGQDVDHRADIFSFGSMAYEILCGKHPFVGKNEGDIIDRIRQSKHISLDQQQHDLPMVMVKIVEKCLERDPGRRYQDMDEMHEDLTNYLFASHTVLTDSDIGKFLQRLMGTNKETDQKPISVSHRTITVTHRHVNKKRPLLLAGVIGILIVIALVFLFWPAKYPPPPKLEVSIRMPVFAVKTMDRRLMSSWTTVPVTAKVPVAPPKKSPVNHVKKRMQVTIRQKVRPLSQVIFRFFPARASVLLDGRDVTANGNNIVKQKISAGRHHIVVFDQVTGKKRKLDFNIEPQKELNLGTISAAGKQ